MDSRGGTMILQNVMLVYDRKKNEIYFYADGRKILVDGDYRKHRAFMLFENAMAAKSDKSYWFREKK